MLKELVDLLTCRELEPEELESTVAAIEGAADDPRLHWVDDRAPERLMQSAIISNLSDFIAYSSKIDKVHEQISDFFADPLPGYPLHEDGRPFQPDEYFVWLDRQFVQLIGEKGGYELLLLRQNHSEDLHAMTVLRPNTARILELAAQSALIIERATERNLAWSPAVPAHGARHVPARPLDREVVDRLKELVDLLTSRELEPEQLESAVAAIEGAADDPDLDWMEDPSPEQLMQVAIRNRLTQFIAVGDKIDEIHEQISDLFADPLPDYPLHEDGRHFRTDEYFVWLDRQLIQRAEDDEDYELLLLCNQYSDDLDAIPVLRSDTPRILQLATELALIVERATQRNLA